MGDLGICGTRAGVACPEGSALLGLGAPAFLAGIFVLGHLDQRDGWSGPVGVFSFLSYTYASGGIGVAFVWNVFDSDSVIWAALSGLIAILPLWVFVVLVKGFFTGFLDDGPQKWIKGHFWILERLPQSKRERRKLLRTRGTERRRSRNGLLVPETRQEKVHWALFTVESLVALAGGLSAAVLFIGFVS